MLFRSTLLAALVATVSAARNTMIQPQEDFNIPATSKVGRKLMKNARRLENNNNNNNDQDAAWLAGFSIRYESCSSLIQVREEGGGDEEGLLYTQNLVKFALCPGASDGCSGCGSGAAQYVVNMMDFIDAYTEMKLTAQEYACEMIREYCYCDNANDDEVCENQCYVDAGMDACIEYEGGEEFEIQRYLECDEMEGADNDNNNNNNGNGNYYNQNNNNANGVDMYRSYYIGPQCSPKDGKSIHLKVFYDAGCTSAAPTGVYEAFNYGVSLPFENEAIVDLNDCISCLQVDEDNQNNNNNNNNNNNGNNNNNQNYNYNNGDQEVLELCEQSYEMAAKCESGLSSYVGQYYYTDESGCEYINKILPNLEKATRKISSTSSSGGSGGGASTAFAVIFALTSLVLGAYAFFLYRKIHRAKVNLAQAEMGIA